MRTPGAPGVARGQGGREEEGLASGDERQGLATVEESHNLVSREGRQGLLLEAPRCTVY